MTDNGHPANDEMSAGYFDGRDPDNPEPSANGRDDFRQQPRDTAANLRAQADVAMNLDETCPQGYGSLP